MKRVLLYFLLLIHSACYQDVTKKILGAWVLTGDYEAPDAIIFRSDNTYLVYNDIDYTDSDYGKDSSIKLDDNESVTALVEMGKWTYDSKSRLIKLRERNFILESSEFNRCYGKARELAFKLKKLTSKELILCSLDKESWCNRYAKNTRSSRGKDDVFYKEISRSYSGRGGQTIKIPLSGSETALKLQEISCEAPFQLVVENRNKQHLATITDMSNCKEVEIPLRGVTLLVLKMHSSHPDTKWEFAVEIK